ncbi:hypothetical protein Q9L58_009864 [Maublancomyces gigas]|uniref:Peptidase A2 domain-containing protein n=1 Tax=Discina gigas TaxID=1032678 RepID=A0ABR3G5R2_9PEZI
MSTLRSREVGITMELELIEVQIAEAMHPIRTRKLQLQERLREQIPDCERENICGIIEILRNGTWGRTEPPQQDADKWILLVGGKPIAAVDSPSDVSPEKRVALLASSSGTIFFEPHPSESTTLDVRAILDSGASFPTLNTFDMRRIDPNSTLSPEASINITTANGVIGAQIFELYVQVINVPNAFALQRVVVAPQFPHVSGNFPWAHCYLAS